MATTTTPIVRCPRPTCGHPINMHHEAAECDARCGCHVDPNTIAVAQVHQVLFGDLTQTDDRLTSVSRQPDGSWA